MLSLLVYLVVDSLDSLSSGCRVDGRVVPYVVWRYVTVRDATLPDVTCGALCASAASPLFVNLQCGMLGYLRQVATYS